MIADALTPPRNEAAAGLSSVPGEAGPPRRRILTVCTLDLMAWVLLKPWITALQDAGYDVHVACSKGEYFERLAAAGFQMHPVSLRRTFAPWAHVRPFFQLWRLMRRGRFEIVNTHSPVAGVLGRAAAWFANSSTVISTVHGFYFHENMPALLRYFHTGVEWLLGRITDGFMFVSAEDCRTARRTGVAGADAPAVTIFNGVDLDAFSPAETRPEASRELKGQLGIANDALVVGIVGRIVREKGFREFLEMARRVSARHRVVFLVVGETLKSDRDQFGQEFRRQVERDGLKPHFIFTGQTNNVAGYLRIMDVFVLPSYREGFPRSVVEAMSTGLPVVATNIRGCREAVVQGKTGLIVPPRDGKALSDAVELLITHRDEAIAMGKAARVRAVELYDYRVVQQRFVEFVNHMYDQRDSRSKSERRMENACDA